MGNTVTRVVLYACAAASLSSAVHAQQQAVQAEWFWHDSSGRQRTRADLDEILRQHKIWLHSAGASGQQADLSYADLTEAPLSKADLRHANLFLTELAKARLGNAKLESANLSEAKLPGADLTGADLLLAVLVGANLEEACLAGASLEFTDLSKAKLNRAVLTGAKLIRTKLDDAELSEADLAEAIYEPESNPSAVSVRFARLARMQHRRNPKPLAQLRLALRDAGMPDEERQVIAAQYRSRANLVETVLFGYTCEFGADARRPWLWILGLWCLCTFVYCLSLLLCRRSGLYREGRPLIFVRPGRFKAFLCALLFGVLSAFSLGLRQFNFAHWIRMVLPRELEIEARGWVRSVSGVQGLVSGGLIALSLLSYFGRPFEM